MIKLFLLHRMLPIGSYLLAGYVVERLTRASQVRNRLFNCMCTVIYHAVDFLTGTLVLIGMTIALKYIPHPLLFHARPGFWFAFLVGLLISITGDFAYYWWHRWEHSSRWLWAIHKLHHSDESVNVTTASRAHWLESPPRHFLALLPGILFPIPTVTLPLAFFIGCATGFFTHMNANIGFGWFNRITASPQTHRIHHSTLPQHIDKNFSAQWPFWDVLFGTYIHPDPKTVPPTGLASGGGATSLREAIALPFIRRGNH